MTTSTINRPAPQHADQHPGGRGFNHYVRKEMITESIVNGTPVTALCGATYVIRAQGGEVAGSGKLEVCAPCSDLHAQKMERWFDK